MNSNITISIKDFCDAMRRSFENERDILADRKELELQAKASGINVSAAKKWLKAEVFDDGVQNPKRVARLIEQTIDQVVYGESLGHDLGMLQNNEARPRVEVRNTSKLVGPHSQGATARGEADGVASAPRTASPAESQGGRSGFTSPVPDPVPSFAGTEGEQTGTNSIPACSSPPEPGDTIEPSSPVVSPTNSDDFDPLRDMPAHLRDRPWEGRGT